MAGAKFRAVGAVLCLATLACGSSPPAAVRVLEATEVGTLAQSNLIIGRDGGGSALLWGLSVWVFGDTVSSVQDAQGQTWHNNSFAFTGSLSAADGISVTERTDSTGAPAYF